MSAMPAFIPPAGQDTLTERQFDAQVRDLAAARGWVRIYHTHYSVGSDPGYPDLSLFHPQHGALYLELKGKRGRPSQEQVLWVQDIRRAGLHAYIVYPRDIALVDELLQGGVMNPERSTGRVAQLLLPLLENETSPRR